MKHKKYINTPLPTYLLTSVFTRIKFNMHTSKLTCKFCTNTNIRTSSHPYEFTCEGTYLPGQETQTNTLGFM